MPDRPGDLVQVPRKMWQEHEQAKVRLAQLEDAMYSAGKVLNGVTITGLITENPDPGETNSRLLAVHALQALAVKAWRGVR